MEHASALVIGSGEFPADTVQNTLSESGWEVVLVPDHNAAEEELSQRNDPPFTLVITGTGDNDMDVERLFLNISERSPLTRKLLMVPAGEKGLLIHTINTTGIHACMCFPFSPGDLVQRASDCRRHFVQSMEKMWFENMVRRQSDQLYEAARNFKKKETLNKRRLQLLNHQLQCQVSELPLPPGSGMRYFEIGVGSLDTLFRELAKRHCPDWDPDKRQMLPLPEKPPPGRKAAVAFAIGGLLDHFDKSEPDNSPAAHEVYTESDDLISEYLDLTVTDDFIQAWLFKKTDEMPEWLTGAVVNNYLIQKEIFFGIRPREEIDTWLEGDEKKMTVARGKLPSSGRKSNIDYHFELEYRSAGRISKDGTIDFRDRGKIPFVEKGDLLAVKTPPKKGASGMTVYGLDIPPAVMPDRRLYSGVGTLLSDDGLRVYAKESGRPFVDAKGIVTVSKELHIDGDVGYRTGNIDFKGHIIVKGVVRPGFFVRGIHLTAVSIEGAKVALTGDLKVTKGILDSTISSVANLTAGFVNKSEIHAFKSVSVVREILDSKILTSGMVENTHGHIIASKITARQGISTRKVGTTGSRSPKLRVGVKDHTDFLIRNLEAQIAGCDAKIKALQIRIHKIQEQETRVQERIDEYGDIRTAAGAEIKICRDVLTYEQKEGRPSAVQLTAQRINRLKKQIAEAETGIRKSIELQGNIRNSFEELNEAVVRQEEKKMGYFQEKQNIEAFSLTVDSVPLLEVGHTLHQDTLVAGPNSQIKILRDMGRCKVEEHLYSSDGLYEYSMQVK